MKQLADFILRHSKPILSILLIIAVAALFPAIQIRTDFNLENFFPEEDPTIRDYQYLEQEFGRDDNIIMVGFQSDSLFSPAVLRDLNVLTDSIAAIPLVTDVRSLWTEDDIESDGINLRFDPYLQPGGLEQFNRDSLRSSLTTDPFLKNYLINESGTVTALYLEIDEDRNNFDTRDRILQKLDSVLNPYRSSYDFKISGIPYYRNQYVHFLNDEILFYITLSTVLIILLLWLLYRSALGIMLPIAIVWLTILFTLAVMQLTGGYFEVMSSTIAPILLAVGIADSVHMISKYDDARLQGLDRPVSIREMLYTLGSATFLTSITTAIGFGTLVTSNIVPMQRFGIYTAAGVMIAFLVTILLLPSGLRLTRVNRVFKDKSKGIFQWFQIYLGRINRFNSRYFKQITLGCLLFSILMGSGIFLLQINGKVFDELGRDTKPIRYADFFADNLAPPFPLEIIIDTGSENGITDPVFLRRLEDLRDHLKTYPEFDRVVSFNTLMKEVHKVMAPDRAAKRPLPDDERLIAQYLLLLEVNNAEPLERVADFSYQKVRVSAQVFDVGSSRINELQDSLKSYLAETFPGSTITLTGSTILSADLNGKIVASLFKSIGLAFLLISVVMAFLFRNFRLVILSLVPNILPLIIVAGFMGFAGIDIKASTAVIFTIAFGIAVDDSIHFLARLRIEMKRGKSLNEALQTTTIKTGKAIIVTSLILIAGFGSLVTSVFISTVYMGMLVCITIFGALLADLFLLPSLFYWIRPEIKFVPGTSSPAPKSAPEPARGEVSHQS